MKTRHFLVVFPLVLSLLTFGFSSLAEFSLDPEIIDSRIPEIAKDYFPSSPPSILVSSKSESQVPLWHDRLCLQLLQWTHQPGTLSSSPEIVPSSANSPVALRTVMRCWSSLKRNRTELIFPAGIRFSTNPQLRRENSWEVTGRPFTNPYSD